MYTLHGTIVMALCNIPLINNISNHKNVRLHFTIYTRDSINNNNYYHYYYYLYYYYFYYYYYYFNISIYNLYIFYYLNI